METLHTISKETGDMHKTPGFMGFMKKIKDGVFRAMNEGKKEGIFQSMSSEQKMPGQNSFKEGLTGEEKIRNMFSAGVHGKKETNVYQDIKVVKGGPLSSNGIKGSHKYAYQTGLYDKSGKAIGTIQKGTEVVFDKKDDNLMVFVTRDEKTGRNMAYARIAGTIDENNIITPLSGFIRVPSLDKRVNKTQTTEHHNNTSIQKPESLFRGNIGTNSQEIPEKVMKDIVCEYLQNQLIPYAQKQCNHLLREARSKMIQEVIETGVSKEKSSAFSSYMKYLDESKKHEALIELAQKNQNLFLSDATIQMYLKGLRNKPVWNELVVKASKNNYRKMYS